LGPEKRKELRIEKIKQLIIHLPKINNEQKKFYKKFLCVLVGRKYNAQKNIHATEKTFEKKIYIK